MVIFTQWVNNKKSMLMRQPYYSLAAIFQLYYGCELKLVWVYLVMHPQIPDPLPKENALDAAT